MQKLIQYFRAEHQMVISEKTAQRLASTVRNMRKLDPYLRFGVTGSDASAILPRRVDATLGELRAVLTGRRGVA